MPKNYKWLYSYETYAFDTPDGNIHKGEYVVLPDGKHKVCNADGCSSYKFLVADTNDSYGFKKMEELDITSLTEIHITGSRAFDVFEDPDMGIQEKSECNLQTYRDLALMDASPRIKVKE